MNDEMFFDRVDRIRAKLYKIAYSYLQSESMAVDAVDEAVYKGYLKKKQLREERFMETWLIRILMNVCNNQLRRGKRERPADRLPERESPDEYAGIPLRVAIQNLPEELRAPVMLKYFGRYTIAEIADILDVAQGTVATRLRRALKLLRLEMEEDIYE